MKQSLRSSLAVTARAAGREGRSRQQRSLPGGKTGHAPKRRLPESGYFADVDPKSRSITLSRLFEQSYVCTRFPDPSGPNCAGVGEVSPALSFVEKTDINKRPGRYQSDFIWNTDWQSQVRSLSCQPNARMWDRLPLSQRRLQLDREAAEAAKKHSIAASSPAQPSGGLGLARVQDLNRWLPVIGN